MTRSAAEALAHVAEEARNPTLPAELGWCLKYCRIQYDIPAKYGTAYLSGINADPQAGPPPAGAAIYWRNADWQTGTAGHIAIAAGNGQCWTTDLTADGGRDPGRFHLVPIDLIRSRWGLVLMGWSWTVNDVVIPHGDDELGGGDPLDWLDMASLDDVKNAVRAVLNEGTGVGQQSWAGTAKATLADVQATFNATVRPPVGTYRIKTADKDAQYLIAGGIRVWIRDQADLTRLRADELKLEVVDADDTRWSFPLVGPDAP